MTEKKLARASTASLPSKKTAPTFIVPHTWPNVKNAEYEVLQRIARAATNIGATMIVTDNDGYPLWSNNSLPLDKLKPVEPSSVDFMISLHFESPRLFDVYSYYALWQPLEFYDVFGYEKTSEQVLTHVDCLSCRSDAADFHARNLFDGVRMADGGAFPTLFHSPPKPYFKPAITKDSKLFYVGINWERINSERGRHQDLLERLDSESLIDIYGPRLFLGVEPWRGFSCYRGELPFDGESVVQAVHKSGICLALSSEAHQNSALMSNRLFEGLAAGAVIIANQNGFIDRFFSDVVYVIDDKVSDDDLFFQIKEILDNIRSDPDAANERALKGQKRLEEMFSLEGCLSNIASGHPEKRQLYETSFLSNASVTVIVVCTGSNLSDVEECLREVISQTSVTISVVLVCDTSFKAHYTEHLSGLVASHVTSFDILCGNLADQDTTTGGAGSSAPKDVTGPIVQEALQSVRTDFFAFLRPGETWFRDHLASVAKAIEMSPTAVFGMSGALTQQSSYAAQSIKISRAVDTVRCHEPKFTFVYDEGAMDFGRYVFKSELLSSLSNSCWRILSGEEPYLIRAFAALKGDLAQSGFASFVRVAGHPSGLSSPPIKTAQQRRFIRDALAADLNRADMPMRAPAAAATAAVAIKNGGGAKPIVLGVMMDVRQNGNGLAYLTSGFSTPETDFVWADGQTASFAFDIANPAGFDIHDIDLAIRLSGRYSRGSGRPQHCAVLVNGVLVAYAEIPEADTLFEFRLPKGLLSRGTIHCQIVADHAEQVVDSTGHVIDGRRLGFRISRLGLMPIPIVLTPEAQTATRYKFGSDEPGLAFLDNGFYPADKDRVWMGGEAAHLKFCLKPGKTFGRLKLELAGLSDRATGSAQSVTVALNNQKLGTLKLSENFEEYSLPVFQESSAYSGISHVTLTAKHASSLVNGVGQLADQRSLSIAVRAMQVEEIHRIALGQTVSFGDDGQGQNFIVSGFAQPEAQFTWIDGKNGKLQILVEEAESVRSFELVCVLGGREASVGTSKCKVMLNGIVLGTISLSPEAAEFRLRTPSLEFDPEKPLLLEFQADRAEPVRNSSGTVLDARLLAVRVHSIKLAKAG